MEVNRGYIDYRSNGPLLAVAWCDRRKLYFSVQCNNKQTLTLMSRVKHKNPDGTTRTDVTFLPLLPDYQQYMRGVDQGDQFVT